MSPPVPHLVDEILEEIFLRLPTPEALARASTASPHFHRIITDRPFLRRYTLLPPMPMDQEKAPSEIKPILVPIGEEEDETSFKVICLADFETKLLAFVFSSVAPKWSVATSTSWTSLGSRPDIRRCVPYSECNLSRFDYAHGCFYSPSPWMDKLLVLDTHKMEFSTVSNVLVNDMQPGIVVGKKGALEMFSLTDEHRPDGLFDIYHTTQQNNGESSKDWQLENIIPLPRHYKYSTIGAAEGFLFLRAIVEDRLDVDEDYTVSLSRTGWTLDYFSLEVRTSELMKVCRRKKSLLDGEPVYWYFGYPPSLSQPSI